MFWQVSKNNETLTLTYYSWLNHIRYNEVKENPFSGAFTNPKDRNNSCVFVN